MNAPPPADMRIRPEHQAEIDNRQRTRPARLQSITAMRPLPAPAVEAITDPATVQAEVEAFLARHRHLAVLTGAGISTASGIPDYRGVDGQWQRGSPITYQGYMHDTALRARYWRRSFVGWPMLRTARPNAAHLALARWAHAGRISGLITQNVDGLHAQAGQPRVIDLHGRIDRVQCMDCGCQFSRDDIQARLQQDNPHWVKQQATQTPDGDADVDEAALPGFVAPVCPACGGMLKPDVVFFGESVPAARVRETEAIIADADALLVVGSSLMVYSGYRFARLAAQLGKPIALLTLGRTRADDLATHRWQVDCGVLGGMNVQPITG
ncbi:MAG: NAD-dependent protein deacetylase [Lautropia sp.]|nr:NAD-dependent protein deacetylase [Lautropia sp.]